MSKSWRYAAVYTRLTEYASRDIYSGNVNIASNEISDLTLSLATLGIGREVQRKFYKNIYLYGALDLFAGYGAASTSYLIVDKPYYGQESIIVGRFTSRNGAAVYSALVPGLGAKILVSRFSGGLELNTRMEAYTVKNVLIFQTTFGTYSLLLRGGFRF